ncbi:helix-turn-helix transcriptional regulator [Streptomyces erythrogriseus]
MTTTTAPPVGVLLRRWRERRRRSQLDVALAAELSTRHLSCVETGRARPSRDLVRRLCDELDVPLRERNPIYLAAGFAPCTGSVPSTTWARRGPPWRRCSPDTSRTRPSR